MATLKLVIPRVESLEGKVSSFIDRHEVREELRDKVDAKRARIHFVLLGGLITIVTGCAIALFTWILEGHHTVVSNDTHSQTMQDAAVPVGR